MEPSSPPIGSEPQEGAFSSPNITTQLISSRSESSLPVPAALQQILPNAAFQRLMSTIRTGQSVLNNQQQASNFPRPQSNEVTAPEQRRRGAASDADSSSNTDIESGSSSDASTASAPVPEQSAEEVAAAAAQARQQLQTTIELQNALKSIMTYLAFNFPYYLICFGVLLYYYMPTIGMFLWNFSHFIAFNDTIKKQVALKENRQVSPLLNVIGWAILHIASTLLVFPSSGLLIDALLFRAIPDLNFLGAIWMIVFNDSLLKLFGMIVKCATVIAVGHKPPFDARGRMYAFIDLLLHYLRQYAPVSVWLAYFATLNSVPKFLFGSLYVGVKIWRSFQRLRLSFPFMKAFFLGRSPFGKYATPNQIQEANSESCSVCQDGFTRPVVLQCGHIFCESCIATWFEREATCPLCRASVSHAGTPTHSDGSTSLLSEVF